MGDITSIRWPFETINIPDGVTLAEFDFAGSPAPKCDDHNFRISIDGDCFTESMNPILFKGEFEPITFEKTEEVTEDGFGGEKTILKRVDRIYNLKTFADLNFVNHFHNLAAGAEYFKIEDLIGSAADIEIYKLEVEVNPLGRNLYEVILSFKTELAGHKAVGLAGCCKPLYEEAPYEDDCPDPGNGNGNGNGEEPDCSELDISISKTGDDLEANVSGAPGAYQVNWLFRPNENSPWETLIENASMVQLDEPGIYRAVLLAEGCDQKSDNYLYAGECHGIGVTLAQVENTLVATPTGACPNGIYEFYLWNDSADEWDLQTHDDSAVFVPSQDGLYKTVYICGECEVENVALFSEDAECTALDIGIDRDGNELQATGVGGAVDPSYQWYRDVGNGFIELSGETGSTLQLPGNGLFKLVVTDEGCEYEAQKLVLDPVECDPCDSVAVGISYEGDQLTAHTVGCEESGITWFTNDGNGWTQVGSGANHTTQSTGLYRARVTCGDCTKDAYFLVCEVGEGWPGGFDVLEYSEFMESGDSVQLPTTPEDVLLVFKNNLMLKKDAPMLGWSWTESTDTVNLSDPVSTYNPEGGETITILYKIEI